MKSSSTGESYPMQLILRVVGMSRSSWYGKYRIKSNPGKRGKKPQISDSEALERIRAVIASISFIGEGYKKVHSRLRKQGITVSKDRVLKLMRENDLLSPYRHQRAVVRKNEHKGHIVTSCPNRMWATDGKKFFTQRDGWCWLFPVIDHFNDEIIAISIAKTGSRFVAMEAIRSSVYKRFGSVEKGICADSGLYLRSDHGSQYDSRDFRAEMDFLGLRMSYAFVRSPQCNGCIERFNRTIEEEVLSVNTFETIQEAEKAIVSFIESYNNTWIVHRLNLQSPIAFRKEYEKRVLSGNRKPEDHLSKPPLMQKENKKRETKVSRTSFGIKVNRQTICPTQR